MAASTPPMPFGPETWNRRSGLLDAQDWEAAAAVLAQFPERDLEERVLQARMRIAQGRRDFAAALSTVDLLLKLQPDHAGFANRRIVFLFELGQSAQAVQDAVRLLDTGRATEPVLIRAARSLLAGGEDLALAQDFIAALRQKSSTLPGFALAEADLAIRKDDKEAALAAIDRGLLHHPDDPSLRKRRGDLLGSLSRGAQAKERQAHLAKIDLLLAQSQISWVADAIDAARRAVGDSAELTLREARLRRGQGDPDGVLACLAGLPLPRSPAARIEEALALRQKGQVDAAIALLAALRTEAADNYSAAVQHVTALIEAGRFDEALHEAAGGVGQWPDKAQARRLWARALRLKGRLSEAVATLQEAAACFPEDIETRCDLAGALRQLGQLDAAHACIAPVAVAHPRHLQATMIAAEIAEAIGEPSLAKRHLLTAFQAWSAADAAPPGDVPALLALRVADLLRLEPNSLQGRAARAQLLVAVGRLLDAQAMRLLRLCGDTGDSAGELVAVSELLGRNSLDAQVAISLIRHLVSRVGIAATAPVGERTVARVGKDAHLAALMIRAILDGPTVSLAQARAAGRRSAKGPNEAAVIGRLLRGAGLARTSVRYLSRAVRGWPDDVQIRIELAESLEADGQSDAALDCVAACMTRNPDFAARQAPVLRVQLLARMGRLRDCLAEIAQIAKPSSVIHQTQLRIALATGDLDAAEAAVRARLSDPAVSRGQKAHFSISLDGTQLNELRFLRQFEAMREVFDPLEFVSAAQAVVARWADRKVDGGSQDVVPRQVLQYWDRAPIPAEIAAVMQSWQAAPGFAYRRFDMASARAYLQEHFDPDWARAFRAARHPAEQADFFRLAYLAVEGGVYADTDDRRVGDLDALLTRAGGALFCLEPFGAVANNFIAVPPGHPAILDAADEARRALLDQDNSNIWTKTGPGLLTRAIARHLAGCEADNSTPRLALCRKHQLARTVQFHLRIA